MKNGSMVIKAACLVVCAVFLFSGCANSAKDGTGNTAEGVIELKLAHFFPPTHPAETQLVAGWAEAISQATNGRVKIVSYPGETLRKAADIYSGVRQGVSDIGLSCFSYNAGMFPVMEAFELPGIVYNSAKAASKAAWEGVKELNPKEVSDTKLLMIISTGPGDIFSKKPVKSLEDLKGLQIRATGVSAETLGYLGATPVGMPQSDAYEALQKGVVDGNLAPLEVLKAWNHADVTDYITKTPFLYNTLFYVTMNLDKWNSLPEDIKQAITETTERFFEETAAGLWDVQNEAALDWSVNEKGMEIFELSGEEFDRWIDKVAPVQEKYVNEKGELGKTALETAKRLAEKYNKE